MSARDLPARPSLDSLRKQARKLARDVAAGNPQAVARVQAQLPRARFPLSTLSNRDAQLVIAREYGFDGWSQLSAEVAQRLGNALGWAAAQAQVAIHHGKHEVLRKLLAAYPALVSWRSDTGQTLLSRTTSYAMDCFDAERERTYTRPLAAEMLIDAGADVDRATWEHVIKTGARSMLHLLARKDVIPQTLAVLAALGDDRALSAAADTLDASAISHALMVACRFKHISLAVRLLDRTIALDPELGRRIDRWRDRSAFVEFLSAQPGLLWHEAGTPWQTLVIFQLSSARDRGDLAAFQRWLDEESWVLGPAFIDLQAELMLPACYSKDRDSFIVALLQRDPAILHTGSPPPTRTSLLAQALSYGNSHLVPLLTRIWPLPDDLPHAAGVGDAGAVSRWFDAVGRPTLGSLAEHYPHSDARFPRSDLHWGPPTVQQVLDIALAWAVLNRNFDIATFLLEHGADINTDWATHEPASILHEAAIQENEGAVHFLIEHGADVTVKDYRYRSTAEGWARYAAHNERIAGLLAEAGDSPR
jgi:hypothetical protein